MVKKTPWKEKLPGRVGMKSTVGKSCLWRLGCWSPESKPGGVGSANYWRGQRWWFFRPIFVVEK